MTFEFAKQNAVISMYFLELPMLDKASVALDAQTEEERVKSKYKQNKDSLDEILKIYGDISKIFHKKLEQGYYYNTPEGLYIVTECVRDENDIEKEIEFTYRRGDLIVYSYSESKRNKENRLIYYKFVSFDDDGKTILHSKENYVVDDFRIEIYRDSEGYITEWLEEKGDYIDAFNTIRPTIKIKKDHNGNPIEIKRWEYDTQDRIISYTVSNNESYCQIENSYMEDLIISNYKNRAGIVYWNRIFNLNVGKHTSEKLFDSQGMLIREENFSYNTNGDLLIRIDKSSTGEILSTKEVQYNENNEPVLIINRNKDGTTMTEVKVA